MPLLLTNHDSGYYKIISQLRNGHGLQLELKRGKKDSHIPTKYASTLSEIQDIQRLQNTLLILSLICSCVLQKHTLGDLGDSSELHITNQTSGTLYNAASCIHQLELKRHIYYYR